MMQKRTDPPPIDRRLAYKALNVERLQRKAIKHKGVPLVLLILAQQSFLDGRKHLFQMRVKCQFLPDTGVLVGQTQDSLFVVLQLVLEDEIGLQKHVLDEVAVVFD